MENTDFKYEEIAIGLIDASDTNPRKRFDVAELDELIDSVREHGILEPLIVRPISEGHYEIVAGERRYRAGCEVGLRKVPAIVREVDDVSMAEMQMVENIARAKLDPLEESYGVTRLSDLGRSNEQICKALGRSGDWVQLRLGLGELPEVAKEAMVQKRFGLDAAEQMLKLDVDERVAAAQSLLELGEMLTNSEAKEILRVRYLEPRRRSEAWKVLVDKLRLDDGYYVEALADCENAPDYITSWGEPVGKWVERSKPLGHAAKRLEESGMEWGYLADMLGLVTLVVPRGDVFKGELVYLIDTKAVREVEAAARESGEPHTLGNRERGENKVDEAAGADVSSGADEFMPGKTEVGANAESIKLVEMMLNVWEPGWGNVAECPLRYLAETLEVDGDDAGDVREREFAEFLNVFFDIK